MHQFAETAEMLALMPFQFPRNYFIFDLETTGFSRDYDLIWNVGWAVVVDGVLVNNEDLVLNWAEDPLTDQSWLQDRIYKQQQGMAAGGRSCKLTYERLFDGVPPVEGLGVLFELLQTYINAGEYIVGHGVWNFDRNMVLAHTRRYFGGSAMPWDENRIIDTGLIEKAAQMNRQPHAGETLGEWYKRINGGRSKAKWALEPYCAEKYDLANRFNLDLSLAHGGGFDCVLTHALMETFREIAETING